MTMIKRKFMSGALVDDAALGDRQIRVIVSTPTPDRVKDVMEPSGCDLFGYSKNPIVLADHDRKSPIGTAQVEVKSERVEAVVTFAPVGASAKADEYCALAKAGVLNTVSPGFLEIEAEPIKGGGVRVKRWELLELSLVSVPANPEATIIARELRERDAGNWKVGASRNLPLAETADWDSEAAAASIFEKAGFDGDDPDTGFVRKGFLVYDAAAPKLKSSYMLPFAKVVDGRLTAVSGGIRAAASRLPQAEIPDDGAEKARGVLDHYEAKMTDQTKSARSIRTKAVATLRRKDLYDVSSLAYVVQQLVSLALGADWERDCEGDDSDLPEMLAEIARAAGEALIAMNEEETRECLARLSDLLPAEQKAYVDEGRSPAIKALRAAAARIKSGRAFSSANRETMVQACKSILSGHDAIKAMLDQSSDSSEPEEEQPATDTAKGAPAALSEREREIELLRLKHV